MIEKLAYTIPNVCKITELEKICFGKDCWTFKQVRLEFENTYSNIFAYTENEEIIGYVIVRGVVDELQVCNLAVHPDYRRRGIATELLLYLTELCDHLTNKVPEMQVALEVNTHNVPALNLYLKCGFKKAGVRKDFYRTSRYPTRDAYTLIYKTTVENNDSDENLD